jgi:hypothetical protein
MVMSTPTSPALLHIVYYKNENDGQWYVGTGAEPGLVQHSAAFNDYSTFFINGASLKV